jgi:hypothetical protein
MASVMLNNALRCRLSRTCSVTANLNATKTVVGGLRIADCAYGLDCRRCDRKSLVGACIQQSGGRLEGGANCKTPVTLLIGCEV